MAIILDADVIIRGEKGTFDLNKWVALIVAHAEGGEHIHEQSPNL
jgi:hypothetical protein